MRTIAIKMKTYAGSVNIINNNNLERQMLNFMVGIMGALALCYVFLIGSMILNIVERNTLEADARTLRTEVGEMELVYLAVSNKVDLNLAQSMGFKETTNKEFATRKSVGSIKLAQNEL